MENIPNKIYLNLGDVEFENIKDFNELTGVSWSENRMDDNDIEYLNEEEKTKTLNKAIKYVQDSYCDSHTTMPYMLLGDVAEVINIITGKEIDWNDLAKNLANEIL